MRTINLPDLLPDPDEEAGTFNYGWNCALESIELPESRKDGGEQWLEGWNKCVKEIKRLNP